MTEMLAKINEVITSYNKVLFHQAEMELEFTRIAAAQQRVEWLMIGVAIGVIIMCLLMLRRERAR